MKIPIRWLVALGLFLAMALAIRHYQSVARSNGLRADSLEAVADTTRLLATRAGDVWARRLLQSELKADSLDKALKLKPKVVIRTEVVVDTLREYVTAPVIGDSIRFAQFHVRRDPFTVDADVILPPPPDNGSLSVRVALDPFTLGVRVGCGPRTGGVRSATATVEAPPWASISLDRVQGTPDVCNPKGSSGRMSPWLLGAAAVAGWIARGVVP